MSNMVINPIGPQTANAPFTVSGTIQLDATVGYQDDNGTFTIPSGQLAPTAVAPWQFTHPGLASGSHVLVVSNTQNHDLAESNSFSVTGLVVSWSAEAQSGDITLSNGYATASIASGASANQYVLATAAVPANSGTIVVWEIEVPVTGSKISLGLSVSGTSATQLTNLSVFPGENDSTEFGVSDIAITYQQTANLTLRTGSTQDNLPGQMVDVVTFAQVGSQIWVSTPSLRSTAGWDWNGDSTASPASGSGGVDLTGLTAGPLIPFLWVQNGATDNYSATLNDGATAPFSSFLQAFMAANPTAISLAAAVRSA